VEDEDRVAALTALVVASHCRAAIAAVGPSCVAVKLQAACFERLGSPGWRAMRDAIEYAREAGLLAIVDGKRGDVPVTARAYAQALVGETPGPFGAVPGLGADAFTANPLLGRDSLEPLVEAAADAGAGVFCLVRTSNAGAGEIQDLILSDGRPLWHQVARLVAEWGEELAGERGLSSVGAVIGATYPRAIGEARRLMPQAVLLLPGVGAQGATAADLTRAFGSGPASALVTVSRSVIYAYRSLGGDWRSAAGFEAGRLRREVWAVSGW
jgi:orotidine-5'-phosphate decarboxylase